MSIGKKIMEERSKIRGDYSEQAQASQLLKGLFRGKVCPTNWFDLSMDERECLDNIANKLARIITGDPKEIENWADISGYAELAIRKIERGGQDV